MKTALDQSSQASAGEAMLPDDSLQEGGGTAPGSEQPEDQHLEELPPELLRHILSYLKELDEHRSLAGTCRGMRALVLTYAKQLTLVTKETSAAKRSFVATAAFGRAVRRAHGALHFSLRATAGVSSGFLEAALPAIGSCPAVESLEIICFKVSRVWGSCGAVGLLQPRQFMVKMSPSVNELALPSVKVMPLLSAVCPGAPLMCWC
jgi:hypothetical protein